MRLHTDRLGRAVLQSLCCAVFVIREYLTCQSIYRQQVKRADMHIELWN